jgi:hypothetical protein
VSSEETYLEYKKRAEGTNISTQTLLATDYLNHFNEIVMLLEMIPDMPDMLEECKFWEPKGYQDHFRDSGFSDKELAIAAYDHVPEQYKVPFEATIDQLNTITLKAIELMDADISNDQPDILTMRVRATTEAIKKLIEVASAIIHGSTSVMHQGEIDTLIAAS